MQLLYLIWAACVCLCLLFLSSTMSLPHPHRKQHMQVAQTRDRRRREGPQVVISHVAGMSEGIRHVCRTLNIRVIFKSGQILRLMLTKVKYKLYLLVNSGILYPLQLWPSLHRRDQTNRDWRWDWRWDWRNTRMPARGGWWKSRL